MSRAKATRILGAVAAALLTAGIAHAAPEGAAPHRVVVAGPLEDPMAARIEKELTTLGFQTVRMGTLDGCVRSALVVATGDSDAVAATCTEGDQVGIWIADGGVLRLRDMLVAKEGEGARETTAVRAAETIRATIALHDATEAERPPPALTPEPEPPPEPTAREQPITVAKSDERRTPLLVGGAGVSALIGIDASVGAVSSQVEVGVLRSLAATVRVEIPFESQTMHRNGSSVQVAPSLFAAGASLPITRPSSFIIPRFGAAVGAIWMRATRPATTPAFVDTTTGQGPTRRDGSDSALSPCAYVSAALSMRIVGPFRIAADGIFGATASRMVIRDDGTSVAYWGQPFGALAIRFEGMLP